MSTDDEFVDSDVGDDDEEEVEEVDDMVAYEADEFDDYSDSFESGGGGESGSSTAHGSNRSIDSPSALRAPAATATPHFESGDRVQVLWADENEWFAGKVTRVDDAARARAHHVQYDDGEAAWEVLDRCCSNTQAEQHSPASLR